MAETSAPEPERSRSKTIRDVIIFQAKLWLEGFKDFVLMPLSLGAAVIDFIFGGSTLYSVMRLGDRFERWVHLYAALEAPEKKGPDGNYRSLDKLMNQAADGVEENLTTPSSEEPDASQAAS